MKRKLFFKTLKKLNKNLVKDTKFSKTVISQFNKPKWVHLKGSRNDSLNNLVQVSFNFKHNFQKQKELKFFFNSPRFSFKIDPTFFHQFENLNYRKVGFLLVSCKFFKSFNSAKQFIRSKSVQINGKPIYSPNYIINEGDLVFLAALDPSVIYKSFFYIKIKGKNIFQKSQIPSPVEVSFSSKSLVFCYHPTLFDMDHLNI